MKVDLGTPLDEYIRGLVEAGVFRSSGDAVREGVRLLKEQDERLQRRLASLRRDIAVGTKQADEGRTKPFDEKLVRQAKTRGRVLILDHFETSGP